MREIDREANYAPAAWGAVHAERSEALAAAMTKLVQLIRAQPAPVQADVLKAKTTWPGHTPTLTPRT